MSERAPAGSTSVQKRVGERLRHFEAHSEWRLSLPAQVVIQQTFVSLATDIIGMGDLINPPGRRFSVDKALETLPSFLNYLAETAAPLAAEAAKREGVEQEETRNIGAIFVLQHVDTWATMFGCGCWPRRHQ
jgi:hypothetical protein